MNVECANMQPSLQAFFERLKIVIKRGNIFQKKLRVIITLSCLCHTINERTKHHVCVKGSLKRPTLTVLTQDCCTLGILSVAFSSTLEMVFIRH